MAVTLEKLEKAEEEVRRFSAALKEAKTRIEKDGVYAELGCRETGAVRRAGMDLSQVLTPLRK